MNDKLVVNIQELKSATNKLFDLLEQKVGNEIELDHDYYWLFDIKDKYDPSKKFKNPEFALGDLSFDLSDIKEIDFSMQLPKELLVMYLSKIGEIYSGLNAKYNIE